MLLVNQDRDMSFEVNEQNFKWWKEKLRVYIIIYNDTLMGFNLMYNKVNLGTFDTYNLALDEIQKIYICSKPIYVINGFEDWEA